MLATPEIIQETAQLARVEAMLPRWRKVPLYRSFADGVGFSSLKPITKRELRENFPANFLASPQCLDDLLARRQVELEHTSGTSAERVAVLFGRDWWNEQEARVLRKNGRVAQVLDEYPNARRASLVPPVCNGLVCFSNFTAKSARTVGNTRFVNQSRIPFLQDGPDLARMAGEILEWSPQFLDLDPVHGAWFALYCEREGIRFPSLDFILCSYEFVSVVHRKVLERVFAVPVLNLYGATETGHLLMENTQGAMAPCYENVFCEVINRDERGIGDLLVTTLTNDYMPLVRYRVGDLAERIERPYATEYLVHGRIRDALRRCDGRRVTTLEVDRCFAGVEGIVHYQLKQEQDGTGRLQFIPCPEMPSAEALDSLAANLGELLQLKQRIALEPVKMLPPQTSGKFRLTCRAET